MNTKNTIPERSEDDEAFPLLSDAEWLEATSKVRRAVQRYEHVVDFGKLAEQGADAYLQAKRAQRAAKPQSIGSASAAEAATIAMMRALSDRHSTPGRLRGVSWALAGFLVPLFVLLSMVYGWHTAVGWATLPRSTLVAGFGLVLVLVVGIAASYVREGYLVRRLPRAALPIVASVLTATVITPFFIRELRSEERTRLELTRSEISFSVAEALAGKTSAIGRLRLLAKTQERYDLTRHVPASPSEVSIRTRGLPGSVTTTVDGPGSVRVIWNPPLQAAVTQVLVKEGHVKAASDGSRQFVTSDQTYRLANDTIAPQGSGAVLAVALIDPNTGSVERLVFGPERR